MITTLYRAFKYALQDLMRNIWLSLITITIISLALVTINFIIVLNTISNIAVESLEENVDISIIFHHDVNENQIYEVQSTLLGLEQTKDVILITKEEALANFKKRYNNNKLMMQAVEVIGTNPLEPSLIVKANDPQDYNDILKITQDEKISPLIRKTSLKEHRLIIDRINEINERVRKIGFIVSIIFTLISFIVIFNTIRITIYTHRDEIKIMKLVGATNSFVKAPYLIQAILYSFFACVLALLMVYPFIDFVQPLLNETLRVEESNLLMYFNNKIYYVVLIQFVVSSLFSVFSSNFATRKYLKN